MKRADRQFYELLEEINWKVSLTMATMQDILNHVQAQSTVEDSVIAMLQQVNQQLKDAQASNDPAAVQAVIDQIDANTKKLSDVVAANTPAQTSTAQAAPVQATPAP